jgi:hypothetical protein
MKKGLLSLLAVALTIVGCQNYDDQFAELTGLVNDLSTEVAGLSAVTATVNDLSTKVNGLVTAVGSSGPLATGLAAAQEDIDAITLALADVASDLDLADINTAIEALQEDINTILEADSVINQNITVNNAATLEYVSTLISTAEDDPNVIVNGSVTINTTSFAPSITASQLAEVNAIAGKIATVLGAGATTVGVDATSATPIAFTNLSFIDDDYTVTGSDMDDAALRTVSGDLTASHGGAAVAFDYSQLASIGGDLIIAAADAATATSIDLSGVVITGTFGEAGEVDGPGVLTFEAATTIDLGTAKFTSLTAAKASSIVSGMTTTGSLTIVALNGGTIDVNSLTEVTGTGVVDLTGTSTSVFHLDLLADADGTITSSAAGEVHLPALTAHGAIDINAASAIALTSLVTTTAVIDLNTTPAVIVTNLVEVDHNITWEVGAISLPNANLDAGSIISAVATNVTVGSLDAIGQIPAATVTNLTVTAQDDDFVAGGIVTDLDITAAADATVDVTADDADLVNLSLDGTSVSTVGALTTAMKSVALANTATTTINAASTLTTLTLSGTLISVSTSAPTLAELNNTATFKDIPGTTTGETPISISINGSALKTLDLSSMEKVARVEIMNNVSLTSLIAPTGATNLLTPGANPEFRIVGNSIVATYTAATAAFAGDGINPATPYAGACIHSPSLATWKDYIAAVSATNTVSYNLDAKFGAVVDGYGDEATADVNQTHHAGAANADNITETTYALTLVSATACE